MKRTPFALLLAAQSALLGCAPDTGGEPITFELEVGRGASLSFVTRAGWQVELQEAVIALGPVRLYENSALVAARPQGKSLWDVLVRSAHAHPGDNHFYGGTVMGEWMGQLAVDLTGEPARVFDVPGILGPARSVTIHLEPPRANLPNSEGLRGHHAYVVGVARQDGIEIPFEGGLSIAAEGNRRRVEGIPTDAALRTGSRLTLSTHPAAWFDDAEFSGLLTEPKNAAGRHPITPTSQVGQAWFVGARSVTKGDVPSAFTVTATEEVP